jgi:hypothetical protein
MIRGLNRSQTRTFVSSTVHQAVQIIQNDLQHVTHPNDLPSIERLVNDLEHSLKGLLAVKQTYGDDRTFNCALDALRETTAQHLVNFRLILNRHTLKLETAGTGTGLTTKT